MTLEHAALVGRLLAAAVVFYTVAYAIHVGRTRGAREGWRFASLCALAFSITSSYAISRPAVESLFLEELTAARLPIAWIAGAVASFVIVVYYNRFAASTPLARLFTWVAIASALSLAVLMALRAVGMPWATLPLYVWKDVHIVFLIELFWSFSNSVFALDRARWAYGLFCAWGGFGSVAMNLAVGSMARSFGTATTLWLVVPNFVVCVLLFFAVVRLSPEVAAAPRKKAPSRLAEGFELVAKNVTLRWIAVIVAASQLVTTVIDFRFNLALEQAVTATDARTQAIGWVYAATSAIELVLQLATGPILKLLTGGGTLVAVPLLLGVVYAYYLVAPRFATMAAAKVVSKALDYSLFRAAKELLYIPLGYAEKTQGKAVIDVLIYRFAKGGVSVLFVALPLLRASTPLSVMLVGLLVVYVMVAGLLARRRV